MLCMVVYFFFKQKTAYEMRISDWSSDVCSSDLEEVVMRFNDFTFAFPALLSAVMITAILGPGAVNSIIAIGIFNIPVFARLTRGAALSLWKRDFGDRKSVV